MKKKMNNFFDIRRIDISKGTYEKNPPIRLIKKITKHDLFGS